MNGASIAASVVAAALAVPAAPVRTPEGAQVSIEATRAYRGPLTLYAYELDVTPTRFITKVSERETAICDAPCDQFVDVSRSPEFYVAGPRVTRSLTFSLPREGMAMVQVRPGSRALYLSGWVLSIAGSAAAIGGAATMAFADRRTDLLAAGGIALGAGAAALIGGVIMVAAGRTKVTFLR